MVKNKLLASLLLLLLFNSFSDEIKTAKKNDKVLSSVKKNNIKENLGLALFFDVNLSKNRTMSCSTCHNSSTGFADPRGNGVNSMVSLGDDKISLGNRNTPTVAYAKFFPDFQVNKGKNKDKSAFIGGQFWDGRAKTLAEQAKAPPTNLGEMGMPDKASVIARIKENPQYIRQFKIIFGDNIFDNTDKAYTAMAEAIQEFEKSDFLSPFDSKYDRFLRGEYELTVLEDLGRSLFFSNANVNCSTCHKLRHEDALFEVFSNFEYKNIGIPKNIALEKKNGVTEKDLGLYQNPLAQTDDNKGKFKTSILRNVAVTDPYMHNGVFTNLRTVIEFYDHYNNAKRTINPETGKKWRDPEVKDNLALDELKGKALTDRKIDALVAFMKTLTDKRYEPLLKSSRKQEIK